MVRSPKKDENKLGISKGKWTPEEDHLLIAYVTRFGIWNWSQMPRFAGLSRSGKSCRLRWLNYLSPNVKHGNFTLEEEETIINMYQILGSRWSVIAKELPGRTDNEIKNYWHTRLKKTFLKHSDRDRPQSPAVDQLLNFELIQHNSHEIITSPFNSSTPDGEVSSPEDYSLPINVKSNGSNSPTTLDDSETTQHLMLENLSIMEEEEEEQKVIYSEFDNPLWSVDPLTPKSSFYNDAYCDDMLFNFPDERDMISFLEDPIFQF